MDMKNLTRTWKGVRRENLFQRCLLAVFAVAFLLLAIQSFNRSAVVALVPPTLKHKAWVSADGASQDYKTSWGLYLAQLLGNVTPGNVRFIKEAIGPLLDPAVYDQTIAAITKQAEEIRQDGISLRFQPRSVKYETETDKVFVEGYSFVTGVGGEEERKTRTYESKIKINDYAPLVTGLDTYQGRARTQKVLSKQSGR